MKTFYHVQVNDYMTPVKVILTEIEANAVAYVLEEIANSDKDSLVEIINEDTGEVLYGNYDEWIKIHKNQEIENEKIQ